MKIRSNDTDIAEMMLWFKFVSTFFTKECLVSGKMELNAVGRRKFGCIQRGEKIMSRSENNTDNAAMML